MRLRWLMMVMLGMAWAGLGHGSHAQGCIESGLAVGDRAQVVGTPNRLRDAPSADGARIGEIAPNTPFSVIGAAVCEGDILWVEVLLDDGQRTGWTAEASGAAVFIERLPEPTPTPTLNPLLPTPTPTSACPQSSLQVGQFVRVVSGAAINLRSIASVAGDIIGEVRFTDVVRLVEGPFCPRTQDTVWWRVYVMRDRGEDIDLGSRYERLDGYAVELVDGERVMDTSAMVTLNEAGVTLSYPLAVAGQHTLEPLRVISDMNELYEYNPYLTYSNYRPTIESNLYPAYSQRRQTIESLIWDEFWSHSSWIRLDLYDAEEMEKVVSGLPELRALLDQAEATGELTLPEGEWGRCCPIVADILSAEVVPLPEGRVVRMVMQDPENERLLVLAYGFSNDGEVFVVFKGRIYTQPTGVPPLYLLTPDDLIALLETNDEVSLLYPSVADYDRLLGTLEIDMSVFFDR